MEITPTCRVCLLPFSLKDAKQNQLPLLLLCGHSFCQGCLTKLERHKVSTVKCPECQTTTELETGETWKEKLKPDVYLSGLLALQKFGLRHVNDEVLKYIEKTEVADSKMQPVVCTSKESCGECSTQAAVCHCSKCEVSLCSSCFEKVHSSSKILRRHEASPLPSTAVIASVQSHCSEHERLIEYFCEEDQVPICSHCVIVGSHRDHAISAMEEKNAESLNEIKETLLHARKVLVLLKRSDGVIDDIFADLRSIGVKLVNHLKSHFIGLHRKMQVREQILLKQVEELHRQQKAPVEDLRRTLLGDITTLEHVIRESQKVVENSAGFTHAQILVQKLKAFTDKVCYIQHKRDLGGELKSLIFQENLAGEIERYGEVRLDTSLRVDMLKASDVSEDLFNEIQSLQQVVSTAPNTEDESESGLSEENTTMYSTEKPKILRHTSKQEKVYVTHIKNPTHFVVQRFADVRRLNSLGRDINNYCRSATSEKSKILHVKKGDIVLSHFEYDNNWYRAEVTEVKDSAGKSPEVDVFYIDFGNSETVTLDRLLPIKKKFTSVAQLSSTCSLKDIAPREGEMWTDEATQIFARLTQDKPMKMTILEESEGLLYVDLSKLESGDITDDRPVSVRDALVFVEAAVFMGSSSPPSAKPHHLSRSFIRPHLNDLKPNKLSVSITHVVSPASFYIQQIGEEMNYLTEMMAQIQRVYENDKSDLYAVFVPQMGEVCVAKFAQDLAWYRAQIVALPGKQMVHVKFVDFGNTDEVHYLQLKKILNEFMILPTQALHCALADVEPIDEIWSEDSLEFLNGYSQKMVEVTIVNVDGEQISAVLHDHSGDEAVCINTLMVQQGLAKSTGPRSKPNDASSYGNHNIDISSNQQREPVKAVIDKGPLTVQHTPESPPLTRVLISHIVHPGHFYIQLNSAAEDGLNVVMEELQAAYGRVEPEEAGDRDWVKGDFCAVRYSVDNKWYRARVEELSEDGQSVQVHLLDYGYKDIQSRNGLYVLSEKHCKINCFSVRCHLHNVKPAGDKKKWSQTAVEVFAEKTHNQTIFIADFVPSQCESLPVELLIEQHIQGNALTGHQIEYIALKEWLKEKGVALPEVSAKVKDDENISRDMSPCLVETVMSTENSHQVYPPYEVPANSTMQVIPTYVDYDCTIYVQPFYPETSSQGRYGHILKENTLEVLLQNDYLLGKSRYRGKIPRDGNCLFRCFAHGVFGDQTKHEEIRQATVDCLQNNWDMLKNIIDTNDKDAYIQEMSQNYSYGGEPEIQAICHVYQIGACVYIGGLKSKIQQRIYGDKDVSVELCYISDGSYDSGHYDLAVKTMEDQENIEQTYSQWRETYMLELTAGPNTYDTTYYDESVLGQLMDVLQAEYRNSKEEKSAIWMVGQPIIAYCPDYDSLFYRGIIRDVSEETVKVFFVDFGDTRNVEKKNLRSNIIFSSIPQQCFSVQVRNLLPPTGSTWKEKTLTDIHNFLVNKTCTISTKEARKCPESLSVDFVMPNGENLVKLLQVEGLAKPEILDEALSTDDNTPDEFGTLPKDLTLVNVEECQETLKSTASLDPNPTIICDLNTGKTFTESKRPVRSVETPYRGLDFAGVNESVEVVVTQIDFPNQVYVQYQNGKNAAVNEKLAALLEVIKVINDEMPNYPCLKNITPGTACCAKFSVDEKWYRAEVLECFGDTVGVTFVDYGNFEYLPAKEIRQIPGDLLLLPAMAICCFLDKVPQPTSDVWSSEVQQQMEDILLGQSFMAVVKEKKAEAIKIGLCNIEQFEVLGDDAPLVYQNVFSLFNDIDNGGQVTDTGCLIGDDVDDTSQDSLT